MKRTPLTILSAREMLVFTRLARGHTLHHIAEDIGLDASTVSTHRARIMKKLGIHSNAELALLAHKAGLVDYPTTKGTEP